METRKTAARKTDKGKHQARKAVLEAIDVLLSSGFRPKQTATVLHKVTTLKYVKERARQLRKNQKHLDVKTLLKSTIRDGPLDYSLWKVGVRPVGLTPPWLGDDLPREVFGLKKNRNKVFELLFDPCSNSEVSSLRTVPAGQVFVSDGIDKTWPTVPFTYINPPFEEVRLWAEKMMQNFEARPQDTFCMLCKALDYAGYSPPKWFKELARKKPLRLLFLEKFSFLDYDKPPPRFLVNLIVITNNDSVKKNFKAYCSTLEKKGIGKEVPFYC